MNETISTTPVISGTDDASVTYRALSPAAIFGLLLGVASALALVHPILWILPPVAAAVSAYAIFAIHSRPLELAGRTAALVGLGLALLFGASAPVRVASRQARLYAEARTYADAWFELIRERRLYEAHELHLPLKGRQPASVSLEALYGKQSEVLAPLPPGPGLLPMNRDAKQTIQYFYAEPAMKILVATGGNMEIKFLGNETQSYQPDDLRDDVTLQYAVSPVENVNSAQHRLNVTLSRVYDTQLKKANWHVAHIALDAAQK